MKAKGTSVMVAVSARHPARAFGGTEEKTDEAVSLLPADEEVPVEGLDNGGDCFTKCRRSSRATCGGILPTISSQFDSFAHPDHRSLILHSDSDSAHHYFLP